MGDVLRVFVSSTSEDLEAYRAAARDVVADLGWQYVGMEHFGADPEPIIQACRRKVRDCNLVVLLQAFRRGWVPTQEQGGDDKTSITAFEIRAADELGKPVLAFLAEDTWPGNLWEEEQSARAWVRNFRAGLNRMAQFFEPEGEKLESFRAVVRQELVSHKERILSGSAAVTVAEKKAAPRQQAAKLRPPPPEPELPETPYPLLEPYRHPRTFAGRDWELRELGRLLKGQQLVLCVHAPSGAGKSSLLLAGLAPALREQGFPVSLERRPQEPGLARRLVEDLLELPEGAAVEDEAPVAFVERIRQAREFAGKPPVLMLDQLDDALRSRGLRDRALARIGPLLAATAQRLPGLQGPPCRWLLCYRHEFHGEVAEWLHDVLAEARAEGRDGLDTLPHDLSDPERSHAWPLPVIGKPAPGEAAERAAREPFRQAILEPLSLEAASGEARYSLKFVGQGAERLATAFAAARAADPEAPLVPELQVVLAFLSGRGKQMPEHGISIEVPEDPEALIVDALEDHVRRALTNAFPAGQDQAATRRRRARALLALRQLADAEGRRGEGLPEEPLVRALGEGGAEVLEKLASPSVRLILREESGGGFLYALSHDRLAAVVARLIDDEALRRDLEIDSEVVDLRRFVRQRTELYLRSHDPTALDLPKRQFEMIRQSSEALLWDDDQRRWWRECRNRRQERRHRLRRNTIAASLAVIAIVALGLFLAVRYIRQARFEESLKAKVSEELWTLITGHDTDWAKVGKDLESPRELGELVGALSDSGLRNPEVRGLATGALTDVVSSYAEERALGTRPPEKLNPRVRIEGGAFQMGSPKGEGGSAERPQRWVTLSTFYMQKHEVTNREYQYFDPGHEFTEDRKDHPVVFINWYAAMAYAAWLGGSLPTEAQWEFAARGTEGREYPWGGTPEPTCEHAQFRGCTPSGPVATCSKDLGVTPQTDLCDLAGNVYEWCRDWYGQYPEEDQEDPPGPPTGSARVLRGGSFYNDPDDLRGADRRSYHPDYGFDYIGFRVVFSAAGGLD